MRVKIRNQWKLFFSRYLPMVAAILIFSWLWADARLSAGRLAQETKLRTTLEDASVRLSSSLKIVARHVLSLAKDEPAIQVSINGDDRKRISDEFISLLIRNPDYSQARWISESGFELVRVDQDTTGGVRVVPESELQDKSDRYYYSEGIKLKPGELYFSPVDLNVERGIVEKPIVPTIRIVARTYYANGSPAGMMVVNVRFGTLLNQLGGTRKGEASVFLADAAGQWFKGPTSEDEWGVQLKHGRSMQNQFPTAWYRMQSEAQTSFDLETENGKFVIMKISLNPAGNIADKQYNWLIGLLPEEDLNAAEKELLQPVIGLASLLLLILGVGVWRLTKEIVHRESVQHELADRAKALDESNKNLLQAYQYASDREINFRRLIEASPMATRIARISDNHTVLVNQAYCRLLNILEEPAGGVNVSQHYAHPEDFDEITTALRREGKVLNRLVELVDPDHPDRPHIWANASYLTTEFEGEDCVLAWVYNVTELHNAALAAKAANEAKSMFLANMSHEIRTPLNAIIGTSYVLGLGELSREQRAQLETIEVASRNLLALISDILDLSKVEAGELQLDVHPFSLMQLFHDLSRLMQPNASGKGLSLCVPDSLPPEIPMVLEGDKVRIGQMLTNLVSNAIKFTPGGSVSVSVIPVGQDLDSHQISLRFEVTDTGIGIPEAVQSRLFAPFVQADISTTRQFGGTGLGLSIVRRFAERMEGKYGLRSTEGHGSTFWFEIPLKRSRWTLDQLTATRFGRPLRVVIAEDDPQTLEMLTHMAEHFGWIGTRAVDGTDLVKAVKKALQGGDLIDCIICDWHMPNMDGLEALQTLKAEWGNRQFPAVIMITVDDEQRVRQTAGAEHVDSVLTKPVQASSLFNRVNEAVQAHGYSSDDVLAGTLLSSRDSVWLAGVRVLVVDDSAINLSVVRQILQSEGATGEYATSGAESLSYLADSTNDFDVVLMDMQMPVMDGAETTRCLRQDLHLNEVPVIALTAAVFSDDRLRAERCGMNGFLGKPVDPQELIRTVRKAVQEYRKRPIPVQARGGDLVQSEGDFPQIPGIDTEGARKRFADDGHLFLDMLTDFLAEHGEARDTIERDLSAGRLSQAAAYVHKLRGQAANLGAVKVAQCGAALEKAVSEQSPLVMASLEAIVGELKALRGRVDGMPRQASNAPVAGDRRVNEDLLQPQLANLSRLLASHSLDCLKIDQAILAELNGTALLDAYRPVSTFINKLNFKEAQESLELFKATLESGAQQPAPSSNCD